ncbi:MAG: TIGR00730 family Rossman fold protein [Longimicrobiales bacterium]|nr:TIGR00730 family Rossman fold protein [Longimicrobiales bacterium]
MSDGDLPEISETEDQRLLRARPIERGAPPTTLGTDAWRVFRIMGEFVEGFEELAPLGPAVSFFGSARATPDEEIYGQCVETARLVGEEGFAVITGGGPGLMEAANRGAREARVASVGLNIELPFEQELNPYVDLAIDFRYFFVRKTMFVKYADAFVIFPGGFGTLDELFEALTLIQTGKIRDFPVVLFDTSYWKGMADWIRDRVLADGRVSPSDMELFITTDSPQEAADFIAHRHWDRRSRGRRRPE